LKFNYLVFCLAFYFFVNQVLESRNIELLLGYFVSCIKEVGSVSDDGSTRKQKKYILELQPAQRGLQKQLLEVNLVLWTVGSAPLVPRLQPPDQPFAIPFNGRGLVETEETLRVKGHSRTFAIGDSAALKDPSGKLLPATAQVLFSFSLCFS
jgi:demethylphylloquinone reductase